MIAVGGLSLLVMLRLMHDVLGTLRTDDARLVVPAVPVVPAAQPVVAQEYGRLGRLFVREGAAVAPAEPLFSLQRDPGIDQELADRGVARDLAELNEQIRDTRRVIDSLSERIVMARPVRQSLLELQRLQRSQQQRWWRLSERQALVRQLELQRRAAARRHPRLASEEQARLDYANRFRPVRAVWAIEPGDLLASRQLRPAATSTGHLMLAASRPQRLLPCRASLCSYRLQVIDSSRSGHGSADTRRGGGGGGMGMIQLQADRQGRPRAYRWSEQSGSRWRTASEEPLIISRFCNDRCDSTQKHQQLPGEKQAEQG